MEPTWTKKEIKDVNSSSAITLKAELLKQKEIFQKERNKIGNVGHSISKKPIKKPSIYSKKNKGIELRNSKDEEELKTVGTELEASWVSLQRKTKIYEEKMKLGADLSDEDEERDPDKAPLVDFLSKNIESLEEMKNKLEEKKEDVDDTWVEFIDEFGRTRLIRKSDMPEFPYQKYVKSESDTLNKVDEAGEKLKSSEMTKEKLKEEQEKHLNEEIRNEESYFNSNLENRKMGVGFYQFSQDKEERIKQQQELQDIRQETSLNRSKADALKQARLQRIEDRKRKLKERTEKIKRQKVLYHNEKEKVEKEAEDFIKSILKKK